MTVWVRVLSRLHIADRRLLFHETRLRWATSCLLRMLMGADWLVSMSWNYLRSGRAWRVLNALLRGNSSNHDLVFCRDWVGCERHRFFEIVKRSLMRQESIVYVLTVPHSGRARYLLWKPILSKLFTHVLFKVISAFLQYLWLWAAVVLGVAQLFVIMVLVLVAWICPNQVWAGRVLFQA